MAAGTPVVATTIGAEGLPVQHRETIRIADTAEALADECLDLLEDTHAQATMAENALQMVRTNFSWEHVTTCFEETLQSLQPSPARPI